MASVWDVLLGLFSSDSSSSSNPSAVNEYGGQNYEKKIWSFLRSRGYTAAGTAGIMGNLFAESGLNPTNLQDTCEASLGFNDQSYTQAVDSRRKTKESFVHDSAGYGLAQWTWYTRKELLYNMTVEKGMSIGNIDGQLSTLERELTTDFNALSQRLKSVDDVRTAAVDVLTNFEAPEDQSIGVQNTRADYAQRYYDKYALDTSYTTYQEGDSGSSSYQSATATDKAIALAISIANDDSHGYSQQQRFGPDFDCSSLMFYVWQQAGVPVKDNAVGGNTSTWGMPDTFPQCGFTNVIDQIDLSSGSGLLPGDVLVRHDAHTAMYIGDGKVVQATQDEYGGVGNYNESPYPQKGDQTGREISIGNYYNHTRGWDYVFRYKDRATGAYSTMDVSTIGSDLSGSGMGGSVGKVLSTILDVFKGMINPLKDLPSVAAFGNDEQLNRTYQSYTDYVRAERALRGGAAREGDAIVQRTIANPTPDVISNQKATGLLSVGTFVESPFIILKIGDFTFGSYSSRKSGNRISTTYPNYMDSINIVKVNGTVNQYTINMTYQIQPGQDPNMLDKIFSSVGYDKIKISYGDYSSPSFIYRDEEAIITKLTSDIDFAGSKIRYTLYCTSDALQLASRSYTFDARTCKPSDRIKEILFSNTYGLQEVFTGMKSRTIANMLIAGDDKEVTLEPKIGMDPLSYLNYLVSCMSPLGTNDRSIGNATYYLSIVDDVSNKYGGPYFKVTKVTADTSAESLAQSGVYEVDVGYSGYANDTPNNLVLGFQVNTTDSWALLYKYSSQVPTENYVYNIDNNGQITTEYSPNVTTSSKYHRTTDHQKSWWTQMTQFPITATLTLKGLLRPAILMSYVRINALFYGQRHVSSGLYIITKQQDTVDRSGYRTVLSLTRVTGDNTFTVVNKVVPVAQNIHHSSSSRSSVISGNSTGNNPNSGNTSDNRTRFYSTPVPEVDPVTGRYGVAVRKGDSMEPYLI